MESLRGGKIYLRLQIKFDCSFGPHQKDSKSRGSSGDDREVIWASFPLFLSCSDLTAPPPPPRKEAPVEHLDISAFTPRAKHGPSNFRLANHQKSLFAVQ